MILSSLQLDSNPLIIEFMKGDVYQEVYLDFSTSEIYKIGKIMEYFVNRCDSHKSPQSLFKVDDLNYKTLIKDFSENSDFEIVRDKIIGILGVSLTIEDKKQIKSINVSYPETWNVHVLDY